MNKIRNFLKKHNVLSIIVVCLVFGVGGGLVGTIIAVNYFISSSYSLSPFGNIDLSQSKYGEQGLVIGNARNVIVQQDAKVNETVGAVSNSLVGIYKKQAALKLSDSFVLENFYKLSDAAGQGFIITSDGWIVTSMSLEKNYSGYVIITKDKKIYSIDKVATDKLTNFNFIHVSAKDLPVIKFAEKSEITAGSLAVGVNWSGSSWLSALQGFRRKGLLVESSDNFSDKLILNNNLPQDFSGSVIFNLAGNALGLADAKGEIEAMSRLKSAADSLFKNKIIKRPSLGINYIDLTQLAADSITGSKWQKGVIIYKDQKGVAVQKNSPAEKAGLKEGDIIISVDDVSLSQNNDLTDLIQDHAFNDNIILSIKRGGDEKKITVTLAEQK